MSFTLKYTMTTTFKYMPIVVKKRQENRTHGGFTEIQKRTYFC